MDILTKPINIWDKNSIRPGPVGSVGDVNTSVRFKQSAPDLAPRYSKQFSGKVGENSGSNVADGMWHGYTSGGRVARTITAPLGYRQGFRTGVGWLIEDLRAPDTTRVPQMGTIGNFGWQSQIASVKRAKVTGDLFLPLPGGYSIGLTDGIPRGSQIPSIVAESEGTGIALPAAAVKVTDPRFGENGSIDNPQMNEVPAYTINNSVYWTPPAGDPRREQNPAKNDHVEFVKFISYSNWSGLTADWLDDSTEQQLIYDKSSGRKFMGIANHTGGIQRPPGEPVPAEVVPVGGQVAKPNPYEYGKPGDKAPVPGQSSGTPTDSVPGGGNGGGKQGSGTGTGLQCRSGNCKGLFR